jgi:hypothetical protein
VTCGRSIGVDATKKIGSLYRGVDVLAGPDGHASVALDTPRRGGYMAPFGPRSEQVAASCPPTLRGR